MAKGKKMWVYSPSKPKPVKVSKELEESIWV
jgi:hypothetical protein